MNRKDDINENPGSGADHGSLSFMEAERPQLRTERIEAWGRFPCWTMAAKAFVLALVVLTHLAAGPARAEDPAAAARAIGQAGQAAAGAIAKDADSAAHVPGYVGTSLPERGLGAGELRNAANRALADPADPGGQAGRSVIDGATGRPDAPVKADDPIARRGDGIHGDAHSPLWGADGIASGSVTDCKAGLERAEAGGHCGSVSWCVGADCGTAASRANTGFVDSAARLNMAIELGGEEFDRQIPPVLQGRSPVLPDPVGRARRLLQELGRAHRPGRLQRGGTPPGRGAPCREHALPGQAMRQADLRRVHPLETFLVRVRLEARAHPAGSDTRPARDRLGQLPRLHGRGDGTHRLRGRGSLRVHPEPDRRVARALDRASGSRPNWRGDARAHPRLLHQKQVKGAAMTIPYALALACLLAILAALPADAREWRPWCGPRSGPNRDAGALARLALLLRPKRGRRGRGRAGNADDAASCRVLAARDRDGAPPEDALGPGGSPGPGDPGPERGERHGLPAPPAGDPAKSRLLLGRLPPHGLGEPGSRLHAEASGGRPRQAGLVGAAPGRARRRPGPARRALRPHLSRPCAMSGMPRVRSRSCEPLRCATDSTCSRSR